MMADRDALPGTGGTTMAEQKQPARPPKIADRAFEAGDLPT